MRKQIFRTSQNFHYIECQIIYFPVQNDDCVVLIASSVFHHLKYDVLMLSTLAIITKKSTMSSIYYQYIFL